MRFPFDFSKMSFLGISWGLGIPKKLGISWEFLGNFLGSPKKLGISWVFLEFFWDPRKSGIFLGFSWDFFGIFLGLGTFAGIF